MSTSFAIINGDLSIGSGRRFETVSNKSKLAQDLELWVLEKIGTDPLLQGFGSHLDEFIGGIISIDSINQIRNEILRLVQQYQAMQYNKIRTETIKYLGKTTLSSDEVINSIDSVDIKQVSGTLLLVQVKISTLAHSQLRLTIPVGGLNA